MDEIQVADDYLYGVLGGDVDLLALLQTPTTTISAKSIYFDSVPQGIPRTGKPVIIIRHKPNRADDDLRGNAGKRLIVNVNYQIVANVGVRRYQEAAEVADAVDELLDLTSSSASSILKVERLAPYRARTPDSNGLEYSETGADWLVQVSLYA